jgi:phosphoribosyl 1,2-cyclic phosphodiesterase
MKPVTQLQDPERNPTDRVWLKFWGVRGSIPTPGAGTVRVGGNTSCVELRAGGEHLILDAGSGIRPLGLALAAEKRELNLTLLLTHTHWDHIQGFPFFVPAYQPRNHVRILGYEGALHDLQTTLAGQMENPYFPVTLAQMPGNLVIEELKSMTFELGPLKLRACRTKHPGVTMGYRIETDAGAICYVPDHESAPGESAGAVGDLITGADVVMLDSQYTAEEYGAKRGWGHGCLDDVVRVAREAAVKRLFLFHHDPSHDDVFIEKMLARARSLAGPEMQVDTAREGEIVELVANPAGAP